MSNNVWRTILIVTILGFIVMPSLDYIHEGISTRHATIIALVSSAVFALGWKSHLLLQPGFTFFRVLLWLTPPVIFALLLIWGRFWIQEESVVIYFASAYLGSTSAPLKERLIPTTSREWLWVFLLFALFAAVGVIGYLALTNMESWLTAIIG